MMAINQEIKKNFSFIKQEYKDNIDIETMLVNDII